MGDLLLNKGTFKLRCTVRGLYRLIGCSCSCSCWVVGSGDAKDWIGYLGFFTHSDWCECMGDRFRDIALSGLLTGMFRRCDSWLETTQGDKNLFLNLSRPWLSPRFFFPCEKGTWFCNSWRSSYFGRKVLIETRSYGESKCMLKV